MKIAEFTCLLLVVVAILLYVLLLRSKPGEETRHKQIDVINDILAKELNNLQHRVKKLEMEPKLLLNEPTTETVLMDGNGKMTPLAETIDSLKFLPPDAVSETIDGTELPTLRSAITRLHNTPGATEDELAITAKVLRYFEGVFKQQ